MDNDMHMVRHSTDGFNLSVGEPVFLQQHLDFLKIVEPIQTLRYPLVGGEPELLEELHKFLPEYKHIVVTCGAKQAILAGMYAFAQDFVFNFSKFDKEKNIEIPCSQIYYGRHLISHKVPYWPSFPTLAKFSNMGFTSSGDYAAIKIATSPNNPDGEETVDSCDIWDACYYNPWYPVYGHTKHLNSSIAVFSGAKLFGVSSFRIGWLCTNDSFLAAKAAEYVEKITTGVSLLSQMQTASIFRHIRRKGDAVPEYTKAREVLIASSNVFHRHMDSYIDIYKGAPTGMFAFIKAKDPQKLTDALEIAKIKVVPGRACGMTEDGWFRFSLGGETGFVDEAMIALKKELDA